MAIQNPIKLLKFKFNSSPSSAGSYGIAPYATIVNKWTAQLFITAQPHNSPTVGNNSSGYYYTGLDVKVGDYVATSAEGKVLRISAISAASGNLVTVTLEDVDLINYLNDGNGATDGLIINSSAFDGFIFEVTSDGKPIITGNDAITALPGNLTPVFIASIMSRFARDSKYVKTDAAGTAIVDQNLSVAGNLTISGNLDISGTTTTINSTTYQLKDPVIKLGYSSTALTSNDAKDRGIEFNYFDTAARTGFFGYDNSIGKFTALLATTNAAEVISGTKAEVDALISYSNLISKPTTLAGFGITDAQLASIGLSTINTVSSNASTGLLRKTAVNTWDLVDPATLNSAVTLSGDITGSGTGSVVTTLAASGVTAGTYTKVTVDAKGRVTTGTAITATEIPALDTSKITTGTLAAARLPAFTGDATVAAGTSVITLNNVATAGTYQVVTINAKGQVTSGTNPTTVAGFGITDVYTKTEVDGLIVGLDFKNSVRAISTSNIVLSGTQTLDGVALVVGNRVLVAGQTAAVENGIYVVTTGSWTRSTDANTTALVSTGMYTFIEEGTLNASTGWVLATIGTVTLGTTALTFTQFNGLAGLTAGTGLIKSGNTLSLAAVAQGSVGSLVKVNIDSYGRVSGNTAVVQSDITGLLGVASITNSMLANTALSSVTGTNSGDETTNTIRTKLGITTLSGSNTGDQTITLTGDVTGSGTGSFATTLAATGVAANTYAKVTVDAKGRVTAGTTLATTDIPTLDAATKLSGTLATAQLPSFTGDATSAAGTSILTLAASGATAGTYKSVTVDNKGRVTGGTNPTTAAGFGITDVYTKNESDTAITTVINNTATVIDGGTY